MEIQTTTAFLDKQGNIHKTREEAILSSLQDRIKEIVDKQNHSDTARGFAIIAVRRALIELCREGLLTINEKAI